MLCRSAEGQHSASGLGAVHSQTTWKSLLSIIDQFTDFYLKLPKCLLIDW